MYEKILIKYDEDFKKIFDFGDGDYYYKDIIKEKISRFIIIQLLFRIVKKSLQLPVIVHCHLCQPICRHCR